jgi:hypothetical protein
LGEFFLLTGRKLPNFSNEPLQIKISRRHLIRNNHHSGLKAKHFILSPDNPVSAAILLVISHQKLMEGYRKSFLYYNKSGECLRESVEGYRKSGGSLRESGEGFRKSVWGYHQSAFDLERFDLNREQIDLMT